MTLKIYILHKYFNLCFSVTGEVGHLLAYFVGFLMNCLFTSFICLGLSVFSWVTPDLLYKFQTLIHCH